MMTFGQKLQRFRQAQRLTLDELAEKLGTTKQVLSRYENEARIPRVTVVVQYAGKLGIPLADLMPDEESAAPKGGPGYADENLRMIARVYDKMEPRDRARMMSLLVTAFDQEFKDDT